MPIRVWDETVPGRRSPAEGVQFDAGPVTIRDLLRSRVRQEVEHYNQSPPERFHGLIQPEEPEQMLNGPRVNVSRPLDWEAEFRRACSSFEKNGFLILVDRNQVLDLDAAVVLESDSEVQFIKLAPLAGG